MDEGLPHLGRSSLRGEISRKVFESDDGQFAVLRVVDDNGAEHVVRGPVAGIPVGQHLEFEGCWDKHPEFGLQFKADSFRLTLPNSAEGIKRFLGSGAIAGIGRKLAGELVDFFGEETLKVLNSQSRRLQEVPGIGKKKAAAILECWQAAADRRESYIFMQGLGITPAYCARLFKRYGDQAPAVVKANPYRLAEEVDGIGFLKADEIAKSLGVPPDSTARMAAAAVFSINEWVSNGNVCCPREELCRAAAKLAGQPEERAQAGIDAALERNLLKQLDGMYYTPLLARAETELPELVAALALAKTFAGQKIQPTLQLSGKFEFNTEQTFAVDQIQNTPLSIITGGPGVGKTTVVGEIVRRAKRAGLNIGLAAPTGRAAKRLSESTGLPAQTLHRLLKFDPTSNQFAFGREEQLPYDLLIVDEVSMLDLLLAQALFRAIKPGTSVVLVGDSDQLPSVGPGTVLASFIASGWFTVTALTRIFRQSGNSRIVVNAHRVNRGLLPEKPAADDLQLGDFYWIEQDDAEKALFMIEKLVAERIPARFGFDPVEEIQVLTPMNRGNCGTAALNELLEKRLNSEDKPQFQVGERSYKVGDKLMQIVNNYEKNVFNGDMGKLFKIDPVDRAFTVVFDGNRMVEYAYDESDQLTRAYAVTVHKSQGCEFPAVVLPFLSQHYMMLQRNLLYTAMTRAKKLLVIVGSRRALQMAVENAHLEPRISLLTQRMRALLEKCAALRRKN